MLGLHTSQSAVVLPTAESRTTVALMVLPTRPSHSVAPVLQLILSVGQPSIDLIP